MRERILIASILAIAASCGQAVAQNDQPFGEGVEPVPVACAGGQVKGGHDPSPDELLRTFMFTLPWHAVEEGFQGTFTPVDRRPWSAASPQSRYSAVWRKRSEVWRADLDITVQDRAVTMVRRQREGTCHYTGRILDNWRVEGSYSCAWHPGQLQWKALIGNGLPATACPASGMADPRLNKVWHEQEDGWNGEWAPRGGYGSFEATWRKNGEAPPYAGLSISIRGRQVWIQRSGPEGTCLYSGRLAGNGWTASGFYSCEWHRQRMPWSATIGNGRP